MPGTIRSLLREEPPVIRSDGQSIRDYLYLADAVDGYLVVAEQLHRRDVQGQAFNFSADCPLKVIDLVHRIRHLMGCDEIEPTILNQAKGELVVQSLSPEKARRVLGWSAKWTLGEGLSETIAWYRAFLAAPAKSLR